MIQPLHSRLLLRPLPRAGQSAIIITPPLSADREDTEPQPAEVLARGAENFGKGRKPKHWTIAVGDKVLITPYMGAEVHDPETGERLLIMREDAIIGRIEPEPDRISATESRSTAPTV